MKGKDSTEIISTRQSWDMLFVYLDVWIGILMVSSIHLVENNFVFQTFFVYIVYIIENMHAHVVLWLGSGMEESGWD